MEPASVLIATRIFHTGRLLWYRAFYYRQKSGPLAEERAGGH